MVQLYVNDQCQVKPLSTGRSSSRTIFLKILVWTPPRCVPSLESIAQLYVKKEEEEREEEKQDMSKAGV